MDSQPLLQTRWLAHIERTSPSDRLQPQPEPGELIRLLRTYFRMTQTELARKAKMTQSHLAAIEASRVDPQWGTLRRIFEAMHIDLALQPFPTEPLQALLRARARHVALKHLKQTMGTMALEQQAPGAEEFRELLEKRTDELLQGRKRFGSSDD